MELPFSPPRGSSSRYRRLAVLDAGKTHFRLGLLDEGGRVLRLQSTANQIQQGLYPHEPVEELWTWLLEALYQLRDDPPQALIPVAHGAAAALVDAWGGLALPVLDYECAAVQDLDYPQPAFAETASPPLPLGLNLGRQLYWQQQQFPLEFARVRQILLYPQYWAYRLSGQLASEVTSLGCHSDLWNPYRAGFSSLVRQQGWTGLFPPVQPAWQVLGGLRSDLAKQLGYNCQVLAGVHDSNASLVPYLDQINPSVISSGTWTIAMALGGQPSLQAGLDMLANVNVLGQPVPTARYMGGREFGAILEEEGPVEVDWAQVQAAVNQKVLALPAFATAGGPFVGQVGCFEPQRPADPAQRYAVASLYSALMIDRLLNSLQSKGPIFIEGPFAANPFIPGLVATWRTAQPVWAFAEGAGTTRGAYLLAGGVAGSKVGLPVEVAPLTGLTEYRQHWQGRLVL
jgi:L-fuculokinase